MENKFSVEQFIEFLELFVYENTNPLGVKLFYDLIDIEGLIRENINGEIDEGEVRRLKIFIFDNSYFKIKLGFSNRNDLENISENLTLYFGLIPTLTVEVSSDSLFFYACSRESSFFNDETCYTRKRLLKLLKELKRTYGY